MVAILALVGGEAGNLVDNQLPKVRHKEICQSQINLMGPIT